MDGLFQYLALGTLMSVAAGAAVHSGNQSGHIVGRRSAEGRNGLTNDERLELIVAHNHFRTNVVPTAANMLRMYWSAELEEAAQYWANRCVWDHGFPDLSNTRYKSQGQNMHMGNPNNLTSVIASFSSEVKDYNFETNACTGVCGHYTQVVWGNSYLVGCGAKFCPGKGATIITCNYYPPGNYVGSKPYNAKVPCSECAAEATCKDNLCDTVQKKCVEETKCPVTNYEYCLCEGKYYALTAFRFSSNRFLILSLMFASIVDLR